MARSLPRRPNLAHLKKQAKDLVRAHEAHDPDACQRIKEHLPRLSTASPAEILAANFTLHDAQLVIAREYGFPSWSKLKQHIESLAGAAPRRLRPFVRDLAYYEERAQGLVSVQRSGLSTALQVIRDFHPRFSGASDEEIRAAQFTLDDARLVLARQHGFDDWPGFMRHVEALAEGERVEPFMAAFEAMKAGDLPQLQVLLRQDPALVNARGTNGNTLLNLATSLKQVEIVKALIEAGADVDLANDRGWTPLHQAAYGADLILLEILLDAGASIDLSAHGDGGTPLVCALFWGHDAVADCLAQRGIVPRNLRVAAGLGRLDLVRAFFAPDGSLKAEAGAHREFYRPHSGFPAWSPTNDPQEIIDESFAYACKNGRINVLSFLIQRGADINGKPYMCTALHWVAGRGRTDVARWLIEHGAKTDIKGRMGEPDGITPLHVAVWSGHLDMVRLLVEHGADPNIPDDSYNSTPHGWAAHFGHAEIQTYLQEHGARQH